MKYSNTSGRYALLDELRGLDLVSMMLYHGCWDLVNLFGIQADWYYGLPAAWLAWAALAAVVSAAPAGHLRGAVGSFPRIRRLKYTLHALLRKAGLLHRANIARTS